MVSEKRGHTYIQWTYAFVVSLGFMMFGMEMGWISPITKLLQSEESPLGAPISNTMLSVMASVLGFTSAAAVPVYSYLANEYGRKWMIFVTTIPQLISILLKIVFPNVTVVCLARAANGLTAGGVFVVIPMYIREISQPDLAGTLGYIQVVFQNLGFLVMYLVGAYCEYFTVLWISSAVPILMAVLLIKAPESPAYLVKLGKIDEACKTVGFLRGLSTDDKIVRAEVECMQRQEEEFMAMPKLDYASILKDKAWRRGLILITLVFTIHSWNGAFAIITYASAILTSTGVQFNISPELQTLSCPIVMIIASFTLAAVVDRCGRKPLLAGTYFISAISQAALGAAMVLQSLGYTVPSWLPITCMVISVSMYAGGVRPLPYIILTEIFSFQVRAKMMGCVVSYSWAATAVQLLAYGPIADTFGLHTTFILFGVLNFLGAIFTYLLPETMGKSDDEIRLELSNGQKKSNNA